MVSRESVSESKAYAEKGDFKLSEGFPSAHRLKHPAEFKRLFAKGKRRALFGVTLISLQNDLKHSRLGFVIPKRAVQLACRRNQLRRVVIEFFRKSLNRTSDPDQGYDHVIWVRRGRERSTNPELFEQYATLFQPYLLPD